MPKISIEICSTCHSQDCDGILWRCGECSRIMCTKEIADSYRDSRGHGYGRKQEPGRHLWVRGHGDLGTCGPMEVMEGI